MFVHLIMQNISLARLAGVEDRQLEETMAENSIQSWSVKRSLYGICSWISSRCQSYRQCESWEIIMFTRHEQTGSHVSDLLPLTSVWYFRENEGGSFWQNYYERGSFWQNYFLRIEVHSTMWSEILSPVRTVLVLNGHSNSSYPGYAVRRWLKNTWCGENSSGRKVTRGENYIYIQHNSRTQSSTDSTCRQV